MRRSTTRPARRAARPVRMDERRVPDGNSLRRRPGGRDRRPRSPNSGLIRNRNDAGWFEQLRASCWHPDRCRARGRVTDTTSINLFKALHAALATGGDRRSIVSERATSPPTSRRCRHRQRRPSRARDGEPLGTEPHVGVLLSPGRLPHRSVGTRAETEAHRQHRRHLGPATRRGGPADLTQHADSPSPQVSTSRRPSRRPSSGPRRYAEHLHPILRVGGATPHRSGFPRAGSAGVSTRVRNRSSMAMGVGFSVLAARWRRHSVAGQVTGARPVHRARRAPLR